MRNDIGDICFDVIFQKPREQAEKEIKALDLNQDEKNYGLRLALIKYHCLTHNQENEEKKEEALGLIKFLLQEGADPNGESGFPIGFCIRNGLVHPCRLLLRYGATLNKDNIHYLLFYTHHNNCEGMLEFLSEACTLDEVKPVLEECRQSCVYSEDFISKVENLYNQINI